MRTLKGLTLVGVVLVLALATQGTAARPTTGQNTTTTTTSYTVRSTTVPGADTGLVLQSGQSVTVTATGSVCYRVGTCLGPDGNATANTTTSAYGSFLLPGGPGWGLVGRVGSGSWIQVGSGPTTLSGTGDLVFAVNDDLYRDNTGSFLVTVTLSYSDGACYPGQGNGDANHDHTGPPGTTPDACYPGHGYGDENHDHSGPPGQGNPAASGAKGKGPNR
jgi:hypothetical protein